MKKILLSFLVLLSLNLLAESTYIELGNSLNKEYTNASSFDSRLNDAKILLNELLNKQNDESSKFSKYVKKTDRLLSKYYSNNHKLLQDGESLKYFDLILYNLIEFHNQIEQNKSLNILWPKLQPRITNQLISNFSNYSTNQQNFIIRAHFILDFSFSNNFNKLSATEKIRLIQYLDNLTPELHIKRTKQDFLKTNIIINIILPYFKFTELELLNDLFSFNNKITQNPDLDLISEPIDINKNNTDTKITIKKIDSVQSKPSIQSSTNQKHTYLKSIEDFYLYILVIFIFSILFISLLIVKMVNKSPSQSKFKKSNKADYTRIDLTEKTKTPFEDSESKTKVVNQYNAVTKVDPVSQMMISTLPKRYEQVWKISKGGMGVIFGAQDKLLQRKVAIKMILPSLCDDNNIVQRFVNEARSVAQLDHPNILKIFDVGGDQYPFFVMEYLEGITLEDLINKKHKMTNEEIKYYGVQMSDAFKYCHSKGIIHRDIKPANVLIINSLRNAKVVDFGIAKDPTQEGLTQINISVGSPQYMAPEQIKENKCSTYSDIYSFGLTLYKMATGTLPFDSNDMIARLSTIPRSVATLNPNINKLLSSLIMKCIELDPKNRFENFEQVRNVLIKLKLA